jgi:ABC-type amino acid transport substrate-binding protein
VFVDSTGDLIKSDVGINSLDGMASRKIGVIADSTNARAIRGRLERRKLAATLVEFVDREEALAALGREAVDGFATDKLTAISLRQIFASGASVVKNKSPIYGKPRVIQVLNVDLEMYSRGSRLR